MGSLRRRGKRQQGGMKPITLRIRHAKILAETQAALVRAGRERELKRAHDVRVIIRARLRLAFGLPFGMVPVVLSKTALRVRTG